MIQPDLCLPLDRQETGRWEEELAEGDEAGSLGCSKGLEAAGSQFEAALKTRRCNYVWSAP